MNQAENTHETQTVGSAVPPLAPAPSSFWRVPSASLRTRPRPRKTASGWEVGITE